MTDSSNPIRVESAEHYLVATLNRPEKRNAIDQNLIDAIHKLCAQLEQKPQTLIIRGAGGNFAAGADIAQLLVRDENDARVGINTKAFNRINRLPMPVIAVLDGFTLGGGAEIAYAADIRLGSADLRIGNPEPGLGIIAAAGASWRLPNIVGASLASEMLLTGRVLNAAEAYDAGLVTHLLNTPEDAFKKAKEIAETISKLDSKAIQATKRVLQAPFSAHPEIDLAEQAILFESAEKKRRMTKFLERRVNKNG